MGIKRYALVACALLCLLTVACGQEPSTPPKVDAVENAPLQPAVEAEAPQPPDSTPFAFSTENATADRVCIGADDVDKEVVDAVNTTLLALPRWFRSAFVESGWSMQVVSYDLATTDYEGQFEEGLVYGSTAYSARQIKIQNDIKAAAASPIHECGHWFDATLGYPTLYSEEFNLIYEKEGVVYLQAFGPTCSWNIHEFLAEGFWCYWKSPVALQKACPSLYNFIVERLSLLESGEL